MTAVPNNAARQIPDRLTSPASRALKSWEALLALVAVAIFALNAWASPYFLDPWNLSDASFNFTEKAMIAFAMAMLIIAGGLLTNVASGIEARGIFYVGAAPYLIALIAMPVLAILGIVEAEAALQAEPAIVLAAQAHPGRVHRLVKPLHARGLAGIAADDGGAFRRRARRGEREEGDDAHNH